MIKHRPLLYRSIMMQIPGCGLCQEQEEFLKGFDPTRRGVLSPPDLHIHGTSGDYDCGGELWVKRWKLGLERRGTSWVSCFLCHLAPQWMSQLAQHTPCSYWIYEHVNEKIWSDVFWQLPHVKSFWYARNQDLAWHFCFDHSIFFIFCFPSFFNLIFPSVGLVDDMMQQCRRRWGGGWLVPGQWRWTCLWDGSLNQINMLGISLGYTTAKWMVQKIKVTLNPGDSPELPPQQCSALVLPLPCSLPGCLGRPWGWLASCWQGCQRQRPPPSSLGCPLGWGQKIITQSQKMITIL